MKAFSRRRDRADAPRVPQRALAQTQAADGTWLIGTRDALWLVVGQERTALGWERIEAARWDEESGTLHLVELADYGTAQPTRDFTLAEPALLLQLVRERVTASIVIQRRVAVRGKRGVTAVGRRPPTGGDIAWMTAVDAGLEPADPEVAAAIARALAEARDELGG